MIECGKIVKIKRGKATVSFDRKSACDQCRMCAASKSGKTVEITVENKFDAEVGDTVEVTMGSRYVLTAVFVVYVIPLILVTISVFAFQPLGEIAQIIATVASLFLGLFIAVMLDKFVIKKKSGFVPEITKLILKKNDEIIDNEINNNENVGISKTEENIRNNDDDDFNDVSGENK